MLKLFIQALNGLPSLMGDRVQDFTDKVFGPNRKHMWNQLKNNDWKRLSCYDLAKICNVYHIPLANLIQQEGKEIVFTHRDQIQHNGDWQDVAFTPRNIYDAYKSGKPQLKQFASAINVDPSCIYRWFKGERCNMTVDQAMLMTYNMDLPLSFLFDDKNAAMPSHIRPKTPILELDNYYQLNSLQNEAKCLKDNNGNVIKLKSPDYPNTFFLITNTIDNGTSKVLCQSSKKNSGNTTSTNISAFTSQFNKILYGAPGTGKSHKAKDEIICENIYGNLAAAYRTTFHPDTDYTTFVGCYKPFKPQEGSLDYKFVPQVFLKAYVAAWKEQIKAKKDKRAPKCVWLVIEEINRGNCAQVFGDIFQLLDRNENGISKYHITPEEDICNYLINEFKDDCKRYKELTQELVSIQNNSENQYVEENSSEDIWTENGKEILMLLPGNLIIRATMNTSDQSLFPMDSAFKRRWAWEYVPIDYQNETASKITIDFEDATAKWVDVLKAINIKIVELTKSNKKQLGEFFAGTGNITFETFRDKVLFYLFTDALKDRKGFADEFSRNNEIQFFEDFFNKEDGGKSIILDWLRGLDGVAIKYTNSEAQDDMNDTDSSIFDNENDTNNTSEQKAAQY